MTRCSGFAAITDGHEATLTAFETRPMPTDMTSSRREDVTAKRQGRSLLVFDEKNGLMLRRLHSMERVCEEVNFITEWVDSLHTLDEVVELLHFTCTSMRGRNVLDVQWSFVAGALCRRSQPHRWRISPRPRWVRTCSFAQCVHRRWEPYTAGRGRGLLKYIVSSGRAAQIDLTGAMEKRTDLMGRCTSRVDATGAQLTSAEVFRMASLGALWPNKCGLGTSR